MPELPDVAEFKACFDRHALGRRITGVRVPDPRILEEVTVQKLAGQLTDRKFSASRRHGKVLFAAAEESSGWLVFHFGMTGYFQVCETAEEAPKHAAVVFALSDDKRFVYVSQRLLGKITWTDNLQEYVRQSNLGPDALAEELTAERLAEILSGRRGGLKSALMNQSVVAGVGNEWSDEILFQCKLHPRVKIADLSRSQLVRVANTARSVLKAGAEANCHGRQLPDEYLGRHRQDKESSCPRCGGTLAKVKAAGRNSLHCPQCQG